MDTQYFKGIQVDTNKGQVTFHLRNKKDADKFIKNLSVDDLYQCWNCKEYFFANKNAKRVKEDDYDEYYVRCPFCKMEKYVGDSCYWR